MRILITGSNGFLGHYLIHQLLETDHVIIATGRGENRLSFPSTTFFEYKQMDFTNDDEVKSVFENSKPDVVIHCGAMSKPDECELYKEKAYLVNVTGTEILLKHAGSVKSHFIFLSTDFVFNGLKGMYTEDDATDPVNYYGQTKVIGEKLVTKYPFDWTIVRTILVYGKPLSGKDNILTVVRKKIENGEVYRVFDDQERTPTYVEDLAKAILKIISKKATGIFHISGKEKFTPYELAVKTAEYLNIERSLLIKAKKGDFPEPAIRPPKTGFNISKAERILDYTPIDFSEGLKKTFL
ncbi:MAG TPA: SDR family oxidoreductase [Chitinophagaceae bacterium]|nr:SDR family oxidoreductase [Chitinophagaceae bacterium]